MGGRTWLPFPVLFLAALPPALLRGAAGFKPSLDSDFTFTLPAGQKECFYQPMPLKASLEIEYQVGAGASWPSPLTGLGNLRNSGEVNQEGRQGSWPAQRRRTRTGEALGCL